MPIEAKSGVSKLFTNIVPTLFFVKLTMGTEKDESLICDDFPKVIIFTE